MPSQTHYLQPVPPIKPDSCASCPFVGIIPAAKRKKGSKLTNICLATMRAISHESISIRESERKGTKHPFHRPCDNRWEAMHQMPGHRFGISIRAYNECRIPYEQAQEYTIIFD